MNPPSPLKLLRSAGVGALILSSAVAWADKPDFAGGPHGRPDGHWHGEQHGDWERHGDRGDHRDRDGHGHRDRYDHQDPDRHWRDDPGTRGPHVRDGRSAPPARQRLEPGSGRFFGHDHRRSIHDFYAPRLAAGRCPPGLAKKGTGCLPPGQARKWVIGQRLPGGVVSYPVPAELRLRLGPPPAGYEFVRVAGDILLIAIGTSLVIDAIEDLGGR